MVIDGLLDPCSSNDTIRVVDRNWFSFSSLLFLWKLFFFSFGPKYQSCVLFRTKKSPMSYFRSPMGIMQPDGSLCTYRQSFSWLSATRAWLCHSRKGAKALRKSMYLARLLFFFFLFFFFTYFSPYLIYLYLLQSIISTNRPGVVLTTSQEHDNYFVAEVKDDPILAHKMHGSHPGS